MKSAPGRWTDDRLDDFASRTETASADVRAEARDLRDEMNGRFSSLESRLERRFDVMLGAMITGLVGSIITHFLG